MKNYGIKFGTGNPASFTGLSPTFTIFKSMPSGADLAAPFISEIPTNTGLYQFQYAPTLPISFVCDGGVSLAANNRFVSGILDPIQAVDEKVGFDFDSFGSTAVDPSTLLGYAKRSLEVQEGDATFNKSTGAWDIYNRGATTLLREKNLTNTVGDVTKS